MNRTRSQGVRRGAVTLLCFLSSFVAPSTALAISAPIHIANTGGEGVFIRLDPNTSRPPIGWMPEGTSPDYHCFAWGQNINGVPIWFNVTYNGATGFYASYYDDSSYHSNEELTAKYGVPLCGSAPPVAAPAPVPSPVPTPGSSGGGGRIYSIVDADGGIYFRNSPSWGDTSAVPGVGVYTGDRVEVICGLFGEAHGLYANRWWSYVANLSRPSAGKGWVNAHYINDGMPANQPSPGEPSCSSTVAGAPPSAPGKAVFFSPKPARFTYVEHLGLHVADMDVPYSEWASGNCNPNPPHGLALPPSVNTLAGWSLGRLGPMYFMHNNRSAWANIHTIILFDPGSYSEMTECDQSLKKPSINDLLVEWLQQPGNELLVLAGERTEDWAMNEAKFTGLWNFYLHGLWYQPRDVRGRAIICHYVHLDHEDVLRYFYPVVKASALGFRPQGCPTSDFAPSPIRWSP